MLKNLLYLAQKFMIKRLFWGLLINFHDRTMHEKDTQMFQTLFPGHVVERQPNILPISVINKQSRRGELEHRLSSQPPRWLYRLFALLCSLQSSFPLSPISHVHKPTLNFWRRRHSPQLLSQCSCMSHPVCGAGVRRDECKERHVGALQGRCEWSCGNSTLRLHLWKTDCCVITLISRWALPHRWATVWWIHTW